MSNFPDKNQDMKFNDFGTDFKCLLINEKDKKMD